MALDRLCSAGLVEPDREEVADGRLRRYYRLTDEGAALRYPEVTFCSPEPYRARPSRRS